MRKTKSFKRVLSLMLTLCMALAMIAIPVTVSAVTEDVEETSAMDYGLTDDVQDGQILQIWNWSYNATKANMKKIAEQGFTAIQTSPIQQAKEGTTGKQMSTNWWVLYQPAWFHIDNTGSSALGNKSEFEAMCDEAEKYGIKVIVDAVLNHTGNQTKNNISDAVDPDLKNDSSCWHDISRDTSNWESRWEITQLCMGGLPDLNTANKKVQNKAIEFLKECVDAGADGFRYDGTKHIEVPGDSSSNCGSDFWPTVINSVNSHASSKGVDLYHYGEILDKTAGGQSITNDYTSRMSVTLNQVGNDIRHQVNNHNANGAKRVDFSYQDASVSPDKAVVWNESHDTYANDGESRGMSTETLNKTWAIVGARGGSCGMYFARPNNYGDQMGSAAVNGWANEEVAAVNHLNNYFEGQSDYVSSNGSIVAIERGTGGVVLVNVGGNGSTSVNMTMNKMKDGTYTDEVTGNKFTVSNGQISGQIGSTGIAAVYNGDPITPAGPSASVTPGSQSYKTDSLQLTLNFEEATSGQYSVDGGSYQTFTNGQKITIGAGEPFGTKTTVSVKATGASGTSEAETYTYTKVDPSLVQRVYFDNSSYNWSQVYAYIYNDVDGGGGDDGGGDDGGGDDGGGTTGTEIKFTDSLNWGNVNAYFFNSSGTVGSEWPGSAMSSYETNPFGQQNYKIDIPSGATTVIFNNGNGAQTVDLPLSGVEGYYCDGSQTDGKYNGTAWDSSAMTSETVVVDSKASSTDATVGAEGDPDTTPANAPWPGELMTKDSATGYYVLDVPEGFEDGMVVFTESETPSASNRYPADKEPGLPLEGNTMLFSEGNSWEVYSPPSPTTEPTEPTTAKPTDPPTDPTTKPTDPKPTTVTVMLGDANGDNKITMLDVFDVQKASTLMITLTTEEEAAADVNGNGRIDVSDVIELQKALAELDSIYSVGEMVTVEI